MVSDSVTRVNDSTQLDSSYDFWWLGLDSSHVEKNGDSTRVTFFTEWLDSSQIHFCKISEFCCNLSGGAALIVWEKRFTFGCEVCMQLISFIAFVMTLCSFIRKSCGCTCWKKRRPFYIFLVIRQQSLMKSIFVENGRILGKSTKGA